MLIIFIVLALALLGYLATARQNKEKVLRNEKMKEIGLEGERSVISVVQEALAGQNYGIVHDYMLEVSNQTSQIDHIVVNQEGVFIIETKNYSGFVSGREQDKNWIQKIGTQTNEFYNPVKQNETHCALFSKLLHKKTNVFNVVVFVGTDVSGVKSNHVFSLNSLYLLLKDPYQFFPDKRKNNRLSDRDMEKIMYQIDLHQSNMSEEDHIREIENRKEKLTESKGACPLCGGRLVVRNGKYSKFLGCSNFPACTYTEKYFQ